MTRDTLLHEGITWAMSQLSTLQQVATHPPATPTVSTLASRTPTHSPPAAIFLAETLRAVAISSWCDTPSINSIQWHSSTFSPTLEDVLNAVEIVDLYSNGRLVTHNPSPRCLAFEVLDQIVQLVHNALQKSSGTRATVERITSEFRRSV